MRKSGSRRPKTMASTRYSGTTKNAASQASPGSASSFHSRPDRSRRPGRAGAGVAGGRRHVGPAAGQRHQVTTAGTRPTSPPAREPHFPALKASQMSRQAAWASGLSSSAGEPNRKSPSRTTTEARFSGISPCSTIVSGFTEICGGW